MKFILSFFILISGSTVVAQVASPEATLPSFKWSGDLRVREQREKDGDNQVRLSTRLRARVGVTVQIQKDLRAEVRLASARANRSTNQSLGDSSDPGPRRRFIGLDLGYAEWKPADFFKLYAGRFPQIHYRPGDTQIILDSDLTLEGLGATVDHEFMPGFRIFAAAGSTFLRENYDNYYSEDLSDNNLNFGQMNVNWSSGKNRITVGGGFFNFTSVQGMKFADLAAGSKANGNTEAAAGQVKNPYLPKHYFADAKTALGSLDTGIFFEYVENNETTDPNQGYWAGLSAGQASWDVQAGYLEVESDAVLGLFTDSDMSNGTVDTRGWIGAARWKFQRNLAVRLTQFVAKKNMHISPLNYDRTHLDIMASF